MDKAMTTDRPAYVETRILPSMAYNRGVEWPRGDPIVVGTIRIAPIYDPTGETYQDDIVINVLKEP